MSLLPSALKVIYNINNNDDLHTPYLWFIHINKIKTLTQSNYHNADGLIRYCIMIILQTENTLFMIHLTASVTVKIATNWTKKQITTT